MNKRNLPYLITYILEIILVLLVAVFFRQPLLSVLLLLLLIMPPISILLTKHEMQKLSVSVTSKNLEASCDGIITVIITAEYTGFIPLLNCELSFTFENLFYPHKEPQEFVFPAESRQTGEFTLPFSVTKAGMIVINMTELNITDYLHLYTFSIPKEMTLEIPVIPDDIPAPPYPKKRTSPSERSGEVSEIYTKNGEKSRDLKQLREYRAGDRIKDIHWNLTAKTDDIMVREYEEIRELYYLVLPVLNNSLQKTLEIFVAVGKDLIKEREPFTVAIYNANDNTFSMEIVTEEEDLYATLYKLYKCPIRGFDNAYTAYTEQFPDNTDGIILLEDGKIVSKDN